MPKSSFPIRLTGEKKQCRSSQRPEGEIGPLRGLSLLGEISSHGPLSTSVKSSRKSSETKNSATQTRSPAAKAHVSAERLRPCFPAGASAGALLQHALPKRGGAMEGVESAAALPANCPWEAGPLCSKPQIQGAAERTKKTKCACSNRREGHRNKFIFVLLRSPRLIRGNPTQPAVAAAALLFLRMSPVSGTRSGAREALVGTPS